MPVPGEEKIHSEIRARLHRVRQKNKRVRLAAGAMRWVATACAGATFLAVLESLFWFSSPVRIFLSICFPAVLFAAGLIWVGLPAIRFFSRRHPDDEALALWAGGAFPDIRDRLADALQVYRESRSKPQSASQELSGAALRSVHSALHGKDLNRAVSPEPARRAAGGMILSVSACLILFLLFRGAFPDAAHRLLSPSRRFSPPRPFSLRVVPESPRVRYGDALTLRILAEGEKRPDEIILTVTAGRSARQEVVLAPPFDHTIPAVKQNLSIQARSGPVRSDPIAVSVYQLPEVRSLQVTLIPPRPAGQPSRALDPNVGAIEALPGTRAVIRIRATGALSGAALVFDSGLVHAMDASGDAAEGAFTIRRTDRYAVALTDTAGRSNPDPIRYAVTLLEDAFPVARILSPARDTDVEKGMQLPLVLQAEDDYGLSRIGLGYWIHGAEGREDTVLLPIAMQSPVPRRVVLDWTWDLRDIGLYPDDRASYFFEAWDNDAAAGPKRGRSRVYTVRFPSMMELYERIESGHDRQVAGMEALYEQGQEMQETLSRLSDDIRAGRETGWETRKTLEGQAERLEEMRQAVETLSENLDELVREMERQELIRSETLEKYLELQEMYQEIASPELQEAMKQFRQALAETPDAALRQEADKLTISQETFLKSIERTLNLLRRLHVEQKAEELVRRMEEMIARQDSLNADAGRGPDRPDSALAERQERLGRDMADFHKEMTELSEKMQALQNMPVEEAERILREMSEQNFSGRMDDLSQKLRQGRTGEAGREGAALRDQMASVSEGLQALQESLMQGQKDRMAEALRRASMQVLEISRKQEGLMQAQTSGDADARKQAALQQGLGHVIRRLYALSQETFFITPEIGRALGRAQAEMQEAISAMQQGGSPGAAASQRRAMGALNRTVLALEQTMEQMEGAQSGLGGEALMAGLEQIGLEQMALNRALADLLNQGRLSLEEQAALSRMAAQQAALKQRLEALMRRHGNPAEIAGRLDRLADEMESVIQDLRNHQADAQTVEQQRRILSRLLEARQSLEKQDLSRRRQARSGEDVIRRSPASAEIRRDALQDRIRQDLLRLHRSGYRQDYESLIRKYFEALSREGAFE